MKTPNCAQRLSRREFIAHSALAASAFALSPANSFEARGADKLKPRIVIFSKVYQTLQLSFDEAAALTADAGLDGIDCPVRPGGEITPERATEELPRYSEALRKRGLSIALITSGITSTASPNAEQVLRAAKKLGVQFYRLGFMERKADLPVAKQVAEMRAQLKDLAALNKTIGVTGMIQNHSPSGRTYMGGDLAEMQELVAGFDPAQIGVAFDIGHAIVVHGEEWRPHFNALKSHLSVAYVKDVKRSGGWVPFGEGELARSGYFGLLREMNYQAPFSLHIESDWTNKGKNKTREALLAVLKQSSGMLKQWLGGV